MTRSFTPPPSSLMAICVSPAAESGGEFNFLRLRQKVGAGVPMSDGGPGVQAAGAEGVPRRETRLAINERPQDLQNAP